MVRAAHGFPVEPASTQPKTGSNFASRCPELAGCRRCEPQRRRHRPVKSARLLHWLIATDLDGTLLDDGYPLAAAAAAIDTLFGLSPVSCGAVTLHVVLATSKTLSEAIQLVGHCNSEPIVAFENGAGLAWRSAACTRRGAVEKQGYQIDCGAADYDHLRRVLLKLRATPGYDFYGFGDLSAAEVATLTGLDEDSAAAARQRMASEPLLWQGAPAALEAFKLLPDRARPHRVLRQRRGDERTQSRPPLRAAGGVTVRHQYSQSRLVLPGGRRGNPIPPLLAPGNQRLWGCVR